MGEYKLTRFGFEDSSTHFHADSNNGKPFRNHYDPVILLSQVSKDNTGKKLIIEPDDTIPKGHRNIANLVQAGHNSTSKNKIPGRDYHIRVTESEGYVDQFHADSADPNTDDYNRRDFMDLLSAVTSSNPKKTLQFVIENGTLPPEYQRTAELVQRGHNARVTKYQEKQV